jgi:L-threonylcarbamoyladenylate synthase
VVETKVYKIDRDKPLEPQVAEPGRILARNGLVAFPTETVYGLGANGLSTKAVQHIFAAKGRPLDNPLILHIAAREDLEPLVTSIPPLADKLMEAFWPGPLTLVFPKSSLIPREVTGGLETVAVRMPDHPVALALIKAAGVPVAAPSANLSGKPSPTLAEHVYHDLQGKIEAIVDGGSTREGIESTVLDVTGQVPLILRPGSVTREMLAEVVGQVEVDPALARENPLPNVPKSPGMKYTHYAPAGQVVLVNGDRVAKVAQKMLELVQQGQQDRLKVAVMVSEETVDQEIGLLTEPAQAFILGSRRELAVISRQIYSVLRECDRLGIQLIIAEAYPRLGVGMALMNRLDKAASFRIINA